MKDRAVKLETIIINKEAWKVLKQLNREKVNCRLLTEEELEKCWNRLRFRNNGASDKDYPRAEDEFRMTRDSFSFSLETAKILLETFGFEYRTDGFVLEAIEVYI